MYSTCVGRARCGIFKVIPGVEAVLQPRMNIAVQVKVP